MIYIAIALTLVLAAYIRFAPSDASRWHQVLIPPAGLAVGAPVIGLNFAWDIVPGATVTLAQIDAVAMAQPRTIRLAGSVERGLITYVTRSALWGFPDYTTVQAGPAGIILFARSRFGRQDLGVNAARLRQWRQNLS